MIENNFNQSIKTEIFQQYQAGYRNLNEDINEFLEKANITKDNLIDIKYTATHQYITAMVIYV